MDKENQQTNNLNVDSVNENQSPPTENNSSGSGSKTCLDITYNLNGEEVKESIKRVQREYEFLRKFVYTSIFAIIFLINLYDVIFRGDPNVFTYIFMVVSVLAIFFIWYSQIRYRNNMAIMYERKKINFKMSFYDDMICTQEPHGVMRIYYNDKANRMVEDEKAFIIYCGNQRIHYVPKRCLSEEEIRKIKEYGAKFNERYTFEKAL